jgi:hypothetical protein
MKLKRVPETFFLIKERLLLLLEIAIYSGSKNVYRFAGNERGINGQDSEKLKEIHTSSE